MTSNDKNFTQSYAILNFYKRLEPDFGLPDNIKIMNPFKDPVAWELVSKFYNKFYNDKHPRILIFGINPGRFGGGITGIPFTDPIVLQEKCGIQNNLPKKSELSAGFIYKMIDEYGGAQKFYSDFFITALSPLGFTRDEINLNYYDDKELLKSSTHFITESINTQLQSFNTTNEICYCLGEGTNFKVFSKLNKEHRFFKNIIPLPHPRWIMQYRRKRVDEFVEVYLEKLRVSPLN